MIPATELLKAIKAMTPSPATELLAKLKGNTFRFPEPIRTHVCRLLALVDYARTWHKNSTIADSAHSALCAIVCEFTTSYVADVLYAESPGNHYGIEMLERAIHCEIVWESMEK
jgi:hypothetical protein